MTTLLRSSAHVKNATVARLSGYLTRLSFAGGKKAIPLGFGARGKVSFAPSKQSHALALLTHVPSSWSGQDNSRVSATLYYGRFMTPHYRLLTPNYSASAVRHILQHKNKSESVTFFFPQFNDSKSLCAETVIRSVIRQLLDPVTLPEEVEASLVEMDQKPSVETDELMVLLRQRLAQSERLYIFIDAVDEFEPRERRALLELLGSLGSGGSNLRVFLAGRESLSGELRDKFSGIERVSMASTGANADIALYVKQALQDRIENKELVVGDKSLVLDIAQALTKHADGM